MRCRPIFTVSSHCGLPGFPIAAQDISFAQSFAAEPAMDRRSSKPGAGASAAGYEQLKPPLRIA